MAVHLRSGILALRAVRDRRLSFERLEDRRLLSLTHLYTFNDGLTNDWIGSAHGTSHGTLRNGSLVTGGQLVLANTGVISGGGAVQYLSLPANVLAAGDATVMAWYTTADPAADARILEIGNQVSGAGDTYLSLLPNSTSADTRGILHPSGGLERVVTGAATADGTEHMAAVVIDTSAGLLRLYLDGTEAGTTMLDGASGASVNDAVAYFGRSFFDTAPGFTGSINEVRIYDEALATAVVAAESAAGPSTATKSPLVRQMEYLDRGMVVVRRSTTQAYVGWRLLATDPSDIAFNLYRSTDGGSAVKLNASPLTTTTDYVDSTVNFGAANEYFVRPLIGGVEQDASDSFTLAVNTPVRLFLNVPLQVPVGGTASLPPGTQTPPSGTLNYTYNANDASVGDLDGDGQYEIILKWDPSNSQDNANEGITGNVIVDAYRLDGTRLWRIDLGRNIRAGAHYTQFLVYDFDGDGRAEVVMKTADGTIDGQGTVIGNPAADYRDGYSGGGDSRWGRVLSGPEFLTVFDGLTGKALSTIDFSPPRGSVGSWGDTYGNRVDRFLATVAYLDGVRPSIVMARGYYAKTRLTAYDWQNGQLTQRWAFDSTTAGNSIYQGQGNHNITAADVDADGKDEIVYGSMVIDDNGLGLYTTGRGHGDTLHVSDMDPTRPGLEIFSAHEDPGSYGSAGGDFRDARTGALILGIPANNDVGRGVAFDIDPNYPGYEMWATTTDPNGATRMVYNSQGQAIYPTPSNMFYNFGVWWDADPLRELLDGTTISDWNYTTAGRSNYDLDPNTSGTQTAPNASSNNGTKSTPSLSADIFGDWREEVIWRRSDNTALEIFTTTIAATNRIYTLMHDPQYREAIAWQNVAYNQPPHPSFFLGAGMAPPPTPQIYTVQFSPVSLGDFNGDQLVDTADYTVWRDTLGSTGDLRADGNRNGVIDTGDYDVWTSHFGQNLAGAAGSGSEFSGFSEGSTNGAAVLRLAAVDAAISVDSMSTRVSHRAPTLASPRSLAASFSRDGALLAWWSARHSDVQAYDSSMYDDMREDDDDPSSNTLDRVFAGLCPQRGADGQTAEERSVAVKLRTL